MKIKLLMVQIDGGDVAEVQGAFKRAEAAIASAVFHGEDVESVEETVRGTRTRVRLKIEK